MLNDDIKDFVRKNFNEFSKYDEDLYNELCMMIRKNLGLKYYLYKIDNTRINKSPNLTEYDENGILMLDANRIYFSAIKLVSNRQFKFYKSDLESIVMLKHIFQMVRYIMDFKSMDEGSEVIKNIPIMHGYMARLGNFDLDLNTKSNINKNTVDRIFYQNKELYPNERRARIQALKSVADIYKSYEYKNYNVESDLLLWIFETEMGGYTYRKGAIDSPLRKFYNLVNHPVMYLEKFYESYNLEERLEMGMPISVDEVFNEFCNVLELSENDEKTKKVALKFLK